MSNENNISKTKYSIKSSTSQQSNSSYRNHYLNKIKGANGFAYGNSKKDDLNKERQKQLDSIMEQFNKEDEKHKKMMLENKLRRKKAEAKLKEENMKKNQQEQEILKNLKLNKESAYLTHLRNNCTKLLPKINNNTKTENMPKPKNKTKNLLEAINSKNPNKENLSSNFPKKGILESLNLEFRQSTEHLSQILSHYKKEDQDTYGKVVDDFVSILENEINQTEKKSPFLESLDLSQKVDHIEELATFGVRKLDFFNKIDELSKSQEKKTLEDIIGYESDNDIGCDLTNSKNCSKNIKPFSAQNANRNMQKIEKNEATTYNTETNIVKKTNEVFPIKEKIKLINNNNNNANNNNNNKNNSNNSKNNNNNNNYERSFFEKKLERSKTEEKKTRRPLEIKDKIKQEKMKKENSTGKISKFKNKILENIAISKQIIPEKKNLPKSNSTSQNSQSHNEKSLIEEVLKINKNEESIQNEILSLDNQYKAVKNKMQQPKHIIQEEDLEESIQRLDLILDKKLFKKPEKPESCPQDKKNEIKEKKSNEHNFDIEDKKIGNDRYKNNEISPKIEENYHFEIENEFIFEEEQNNNEIDQTNEENQTKTNYGNNEKKMNGYYAIKNQKKNQESYLNETKLSEKITSTNNIAPESSKNDDGKIKIINKENLKKLLE